MSDTQIILDSDSTVNTLKSQLSALLASETDPIILEMIQADIRDAGNDATMLSLVLRIWTNVLGKFPKAARPIPRWQILKEKVDALPDSPRSRWERCGVAIERASLQLGAAK